MNQQARFEHSSHSSSHSSLLERMDQVPKTIATGACTFIFRYNSNLANDSEWPDKEYLCLEKAAKSTGVSRDCVDSLFILDRGIINPASKVGKWEAGNANPIFLESYLHIMNFIATSGWLVIRQVRPPIVRSSSMAPHRLTVFVEYIGLS